MSDAVRIAFGIAGIIGGLSGLAGAALLWRSYKNDRRALRGQREGKES